MGFIILRHDLPVVGQAVPAELVRAFDTCGPRGFSKLHSVVGEVFYPPEFQPPAVQLWSPCQAPVQLQQNSCLHLIPGRGSTSARHEGFRAHSSKNLETDDDR